MSQPKRFYYVCDPSLPVATKKRQRTRPRKGAFFAIRSDSTVVSLGVYKFVTAQEHRGRSIAVELPLAKQLSRFDLYNVVSYDVEPFSDSVIDSLVVEIRDRIENPPVSPWFPPAGFDRCSIVGKVVDVNGDLVTVDLGLSDSEHDHNS